MDATPPILPTSSLIDPATGHLWTLSTAEQIGDEARVLTFEGSGHGVYGRSACTIGTIDRYLISQSLPAKGVRCPEVRPPSTPRRGGTG
ncbi:alpha/beta hydrolase [Nonomuraea jiangxiensis]|uniref:TAP-like protein n=1 Tax=Nonomuraea jiangxiensis TaxID=633440 RepID=A0A1G8IL04_9ACTN|nr:alpha/beta hydrolase [Nonomuraea jiangxiensis]SDI19190.1 TAP-like protein [Nonomuraea jiangxiensis]